MEEMVIIDLEERKAALKTKLHGLVNTQGNGDNKVVVKVTNFYHQEIKLDYNREEYKFAPGEFAISKEGQLGLCVGVGKVMEDVYGEALWFLFEQSNSIRFYDQIHLPHILDKNLVSLTS